MNAALFTSIYNNRVSHLKLQIAKHVQAGDRASAKVLKDQLYQMEQSLYSGDFLAVRLVGAP